MYLNVIWGLGTLFMFYIFKNTYFIVFCDEDDTLKKRSKILSELKL